MPADPTIINSPINFIIGDFWSVLKYGIIFLMILYFIFSLVVVRQVQLMTETVMTELGSVLRAFSILQAGLVLVILLAYIGLT